MARTPRHTLAARILARLQTLASYTSEPGRITRHIFSAEHKSAAREVSDWMTQAGMRITHDPVGTVIGRVEGGQAGCKTLLIGSHIDTGIDAGRFDGGLGVAIAIEAIAELQRLGAKLPFAVELIALGSAGGGRFSPPFLGARAIAGQLGADVLETIDETGDTLRAAIQSFGGEPARLQEAMRNRNDLLGFLEIHAEEGSELEQEEVGVGVVTAIAGGSRYRVEVRGRHGHAGSQPMPQRRDALVGAAEMILVCERIALGTPSLVNTVGKIVARPGSVYAVPSEVDFFLEIRSPLNRARQRALQDIDREFKAIARRRQLSTRLVEIHNEAAVDCDPRFIRLFTSAAEALKIPTTGLPSGSRHEGLVLAGLCSVGMLLVRSWSGSGQQPGRLVRADDIDAATRVLMRTLESMAPNGRTLV